MAPDDKDALFGGLILVAAAAFGIWQFRRGGKSWRDLLRAAGDTAGKTLLILGLLATVVYLAVAFFQGWTILWVLIAEVALMVFGLYVVHWVRYPGVFESKTSWQLSVEVLLATILVLASPAIAIVAFVLGHLMWFLPRKFHVIPDDLDVRLGLGFKHKRGEGVWVPCDGSADKVLAKIAAIRVCRADEVTSGPGYVTGTVIYILELESGGRFEVPEYDFTN